MGQPASVIPTLREELDRKVFETIEYLIAAVKKGRMTKAQVSASFDTLFMAVSGLVDNDFINILTSAQEHFCGDQSVVKKHFYNPADGEILTLMWSPGQSKIMTCRRTDGLATGGGVKDYDSVADAADIFNGCSANFERKGWIEL
jgi:hypothetical protein